MFGCHDPAPCNNWLGLSKYNDNKSITRIDWVDQQLEQLLQANKCTQKNIKASNSKNRKVVGGKDMLIPVRNLILLWDHPEGCNKIQDNNIDQIYVVTSNHRHKNAYFVKPMGSKIQPKQVNCHKMFDLRVTKDQEIECQKQEEENEEEDQNKDLPLYQPSVARKRELIAPHPYNLRSRKNKNLSILRSYWCLCIYRPSNCSLKPVIHHQLWEPLQNLSNKICVLLNTKNCPNV